MDELGIEPKTSPMLRERATNYATRPFKLVDFRFSISALCMDFQKFTDNHPYDNTRMISLLVFVCVPEWLQSIELGLTVVVVKTAYIASTLAFRKPID